MTGFESFVGIDPWTALFTFCNMMITFAVLKKFLFKPVKKMIDDRQAEIDTMYADADAAKQKAAELEQEYQQHLQSIRDERDTLLREATARAQKREEEIVGEARAEAATLRAAAEADSIMDDRQLLFLTERTACILLFLCKGRLVFYRVSVSNICNGGSICSFDITG